MADEIKETVELIRSTLRRVVPIVSKLSSSNGIALPESPEAMVVIDMLTLAFRVSASDDDVSKAEAGVVLRLFSMAGVREPKWLLQANPAAVAKTVAKQIRSGASHFDPASKKTSITLDLLRGWDRINGTREADAYRTLLLRLGVMVAMVNGGVTDREKAVIAAYLPKPAPDRTPSSRLSAPSDQGNRNKTVGHTDIFGGAATVDEPAVDLESILKELDSLVGLSAVKSEVRRIVDFVRVQKIRSDRGLKQSDMSLHMIFTGNPGTGKTTVARLLAKVFKALGVVSRGHLVETDRAGLVAGYMGQTAIKADGVVVAAKGGVLFIDEAYSLASGDNEQDYGNEAVETLLKRMEDYRDDLVVIAAGYTKEMLEFVQSNPGLSSRFARTLAFSDYSDRELHAIFLKYCGQQDYKLSQEADAYLQRLLTSVYSERNEHFGNARYVRNLFETSIANLASRVMALPVVSRELLATIEASDLIKTD